MPWQEIKISSLEKKLLQLAVLGLILWLLLIAVLFSAALTPSADRPARQIIPPSDTRVALLLPTRTSQPAPLEVSSVALRTMPAPTVSQRPTPTAFPTETAVPISISASNTGPNPGLPTRIQIPALGIDTAIEPIGLTPSNEMDIPQAWDTVGWYQYGSRPGQSGNAVLAGHLDTNTGAPGIFWRLEELHPGDIILIETEEGEYLLFQIESLTSYPYEQAPLKEIFGPAETPQLSLITCSGNWSAQNQIYDHRLVVHAQLIENQEGVQREY